MARKAAKVQESPAYLQGFEDGEYLGRQGEQDERYLDRYAGDQGSEVAYGLCGGFPDEAGVHQDEYDGAVMEFTRGLYAGYAAGRAGA